MLVGVVEASIRITVGTELVEVGRLGRIVKDTREKRSTPAAMASEMAILPVSFSFFPLFSDFMISLMLSISLPVQIFTQQLQILGINQGFLLRFGRRFYRAARDVEEGVELEANDRSARVFHHLRSCNYIFLFL